MRSSSAGRIMRFQSLFLWNDLFTRACPGRGPVKDFVSILVFMERPLQHSWSPCSLHLETCFNPCFYGTTSSTSGIARAYLSVDSVSILVFMERPLQQLFSIRGGSGNIQFQSLFLWNDLFNLYWNAIKYQ